MPREIKNLKEFLQVCARKDARVLKVKKGTAKVALTKFKVRCSKFLYTFAVADKKKADRILKSIHSNLKKVNITKKSPSGSRKKGPQAAAAGKKKSA